MKKDEGIEDRWPGGGKTFKDLRRVGVLTRN
jgi:hypothetical protein